MEHIDTEVIIPAIEGGEIDATSLIPETEESPVINETGTPRDIDLQHFDRESNSTVRNPAEMHSYARASVPSSGTLATRSYATVSGMSGLRTGVTLVSAERRFSTYMTFKSALEFVPKSFDGYNIPVSKFIRGCLFAHDSIDPRERDHLFWMVRTRIVETAESSIQDRDITTLEELLLHLKQTFTEHSNISHLNSMLATVAQRADESAINYGIRVNETLKKIVEAIEERNPSDIAHGMVVSARDTACENFVMGLKKGLALRVRVERPKTLQDAMNAARIAEWEAERENGLNRASEKLSSHGSESTVACYSGSRGYSRASAHDRFKPYRGDARVWIAGMGRGQPSHRTEASVRGRGRGRGGFGRGDREAQTLNGRAAADTSKCFNCGESGHLSRGCLRPRKNAQVTCYVCQQEGHFARDCPNASGQTIICYKCGISGHVSANCTNARNKENSSAFCSYCKFAGHTYDQCRKRLSHAETGRKEKSGNLNE